MNWPYLLPKSSIRLYLQLTDLFEPQVCSLLAFRVVFFHDLKDIISWLARWLESKCDPWVPGRSTVRSMAPICTHQSNWKLLPNTTLSHYSDHSEGKILSPEPQMLPIFPAAAVHAHLSANPSTPFSSTPIYFQRQYKALEKQAYNHKCTATNHFFLP